MKTIYAAIAVLTGLILLAGLGMAKEECKICQEKAFDLAALEDATLGASMAAGLFLPMTLNGNICYRNVPYTCCKKYGMYRGHPRCVQSTTCYRRMAYSC
jgi:hypothetical protein